MGRVVNKVYCAIRFGGQLVDTQKILGVVKREIEDGTMLFLIVQDEEPYKEFHMNKEEAEIRFTALAADFGNFESNQTFQLMSLLNRKDD